ncbi:MAG TPA: hypothetical protein VM076_11495 [Gemmatimonadaceae bacterium]|nr:hypothetical protein [Gemmatimonadaceae bacterium]
MDVSDELDLDLIAALIDGRLSGAERERAVKQLSESEAAFEVYADALRVRPDLEIPDAKVIPISRPQGRPGLPWRAIGSLAAAAVVLIAVVPSFIARRDAAAFDAPSSEITMALARRPDISTRLGADWDSRGWSVTRGEYASLVDTTVAFRLGVRAVDLSVAISLGDTDRASRLTSEIVESLNRVQLSELAKAEYVDLRTQLQPGERGAAQLTERAAHAERTLDTLMDSYWFRFGRWVAAGELAASTQTPEFFTEPRTARFLNVAAKRDGLERADAEALNRISALSRSATTGENFDTLRQLFVTLIRRHGG